MNDWELIQSYCRNGSESAFDTLVKRHVDFVYCAALRQVRDPSLAGDVSQAVFLLLARKAGSFRSGTVLVSWLFRTTQFIAARALRTEIRRQRRETEFAQMNSPSTSPETDQHWERVAPVLDEALAALPGKDRDAVLLRFIERKPFSEVAAEMSVSEDAAKKRVSRALARLREFFAQRGTTLSLAATAVILGERAVQAAPATLATKITAALGTGASASATASAALLKAALRELFWTKVKWGTLTGVGVIGALWLAASALRPNINQAKSQPAQLSATRTETAKDSVVAASEVASSKDNPADRKLGLLVARAEDREPVAGTRVLVECWDGRDRRRVLEATTDAQGGLDIPIPKQAFNVMQVWISAEGRVPIYMRWQEHEFNEPVILHTTFLEPGQGAAGTVFDESGKSISGAKVSFWGPGIDRAKRENRQFHPELSASLTDANGRWVTTQLPAQAPGESAVSVRVTHPDFTPASPGVGGLPGFPTNAMIVLSNGVALSGRIMTADGFPIPNARIAKQSGTYLSTKTDAEGRFSWPHVEPGQVFVDVEADGFEAIHEFAWATNAANECAFLLKSSLNPTQPPFESDGPRASLHGTVVDAESGEPIPRFKVLLGRGGMPLPSSAQGGVLHGADFMGEGHDGRFNWQGIPVLGGFQLQVEADGYLESVSEERSLETGNREFNFKLLRGVALVGRVMTPDGAAAENAEVTLTGPGIGPVMQAPGKLLAPNPGFETTRTRTDNQGNFRLNLKTGALGVAVVHETGSALLTFEAATNYAIVLQPWGVIEGTLYLNGLSASNQSVSVHGCQKSDADPRLLFSFDYRTTTDDRGHFRFNQVLPGKHLIARDVAFSGGGPGIVNHSHAALVKVESGIVASVELRRQGRPVVGRIVFDGSPDEVHWGMSQAFLQAEGVKPPQLDYERAPAESAQASFLHQAQTRFPFTLSKSGDIRADDVPPGTYTLLVQLEGASADPLNSPSPQIGSTQKQIVVPAGYDETVPVELGEVTLERKKQQ